MSSQQDLLAMAQMRQGRWAAATAKSAAGSRKYRLWVPGGYDPAVPCPLLMMLHGCRQTPEELAEISGMNAVAERHNFLVVYPEQTVRANMLHCWNWFEPRHQSRGAGEPAMLAAVVRHVRLSYNVDPQRIYATGLSAGAAMAVILGATYPDIFAGIGAVAGLEFGAADGVMAGLAAMRRGGPDPGQQGVAALQAMTAGLNNTARRRMPLIVFQGSADDTVSPRNADQLITQWAVTNRLLDGGQMTEPRAAGELTNARVPGGYSYTKHSYRDAAGLLMEKWMVDGLGHCWPGSPVAAPFADPKGPDASQEMWRFFSEATTVPVPVAPATLWDRSVGWLRGAAGYVNGLLRGKQ